MQQRLQKLLAEAGLSSRRAAERMIRAGLVTVNGTVATLGDHADPMKDVVLVDGKPVAEAQRKVYYLLHKPAGYLCTLTDGRGRAKVTDLFTGLAERVFPVGRLDYDTEGLLVMTNDGELAHRLMHPSFAITKVYRATVRGIPSRAELRTLERGVSLDDGVTAPCEARLVSFDKDEAVVELGIHEGRKHQVKRMLSAIGHPVLYLQRISLGPLRLGDLPRGRFRPLRPEELESLRQVLEEGLPEPA